MVHLAANYLGQFWVALMGMAFVPIYIKLIGVESYGLVGLFVLMQSVFTLLDLGMGPAVGREASKFKGGPFPLKPSPIPCEALRWSSSSSPRWR